MNKPRKSDSPIVPMKAPNKAGQPAAEAVEGRGLAKGNPPQQNAPRTQCRPGASSALERVRQAVAQNGTYPCCAQSWRHYLRQEPDAVVPHVRIRGGGHGQPWSLLRPPAPPQLNPTSFGMTIKFYRESFEHQDAARHLAALHRPERLVDVLDFAAAADHVVEVEA